MRNKKLLPLLLVAAMMLGLTGCGSTKSDTPTMDAEYSDTYDISDYNNPGFNSLDGLSENAGSSVNGDYIESDDYAASDEAYTDAGDYSDNTSTPSKPNATNKNQKIIKTYYYSFQTETFDDSYNGLKDQINACGGYVSSSELNGTTSRHLVIECKIPADKVDEFINSIGDTGTIISSSESAQDVTLTYSDMESHIKALKTEQDRLNELVAQAENLETIVALEKELTNIRYELESYQSQLNLYDSLISYSTVNITLSEVVRVDQPEDNGSVWTRMGNGFSNSLYQVATGLENLVVGIVIASPFLFVFALVLLFVFLFVFGIIKFIIKMTDKKSKKAKEKKDAKKATEEK